MNKSEKYSWVFSDDNEMFFWSKSSTNRYLTSSALLMPSNLIGHSKHEKIRTVSKILPKIFERFGITRVGFSKKTKDYYQVIGKNNFFTLFVVEDGILPVKFLGKKKSLYEGDLLLVPPKSDDLTIQIERGFASIFWAHLDKTWCKTMWKSSTPKIIRKLADSSLLFNLAYSYETEVYSQTPSLCILENLGQCIVEVLKRNLEDAKFEKQNAIEKFIQTNIKNKNFSITTEQAVKKLSIDTSELNSFCQSKYSMSYAKLMLKNRLFLAVKMLEKGSSVLQVSDILSYANPYAFSRSFKKYFGYSPSEYVKRHKDNKNSKCY